MSGGKGVGEEVLWRVHCQYLQIMIQIEDVASLATFDACGCILVLMTMVAT